MNSSRFGQVIDKKYIGLCGPEFECPIELGKLREFAKATNAFLPEYLEPRDAIVPPTFLAMSAYFWGYLLERPGDTPLKAIGADRMMSLDGGQSFVFFDGLPKAGQCLSARTCVEDVQVKQGRSGGRLSIIRMCSTFRNSSGDVVAEWRPTSIVPEHAPQNAVQSAPSDGHWPHYDGNANRRQFCELPRHSWSDLTVGLSAGTVEMPPLTLTDIVRYQFASGEDSVAHYDHWAAKAEGFPTFFSVGMLHAGLLATYAVAWLGPHNIRAFHTRFDDMIWPGDELTYEGRVSALREDAGVRTATIELDCRRTGISVTSAQADFVF